jgi:lysophospholipase L1-like esterase
MQAAATSSFSTLVANTCFVDSLNDFFQFKAGSTTPTRANVIVPSADGQGKWHRMWIPSYDANGYAVDGELGTATFAAIAEPATPSTGIIEWVDSTTGIMTAKNSAGTAMSMVKALASVSKRFVTSLASGVLSTWRPDVSDLSGNAGTTATRSLMPVLIQESVLSAASSFTATTAWSAGAYRELWFVVRADSGTATGFSIACTGLGGTYKNTIKYISLPGPGEGITGSVANWAAGTGATPWSLDDGRVYIRNGGFRRLTMTAQMPTGVYSYWMKGENSDTTSEVTNLVITFTGGTVTGYGELWGVPLIAPDAVTTMFLGDSITEGGPTGGYRTYLCATGQYVPKGSLTTDPPPLYDRYFDNHEGHGGFTSASVLSNIATWWAANPASVVFLMIGTNDAIAGTSATTTASNVAAIIDYIHTQSPSTLVYLMGPTNADSSQTAWNALLTQQRVNNIALAAARSSWCTYITMPTLTNAQIDGTVHPVNAAAYALLANAILAARK